MYLPECSRARVGCAAFRAASAKPIVPRHGTCIAPVFLEKNSHSFTESVNCEPRGQKTLRKRGFLPRLDGRPRDGRFSTARVGPSQRGRLPPDPPVRNRPLLQERFRDGRFAPGGRRCMPQPWLLTGWFQSVSVQGQVVALERFDSRRLDLRLDSWCRKVPASQANVRPCGVRRCGVTFRLGKPLDPWPFRPVRCPLGGRCPSGSPSPSCSSACLRGFSSPEASLPRPRIAGRPDRLHRPAGTGWHQSRPTSPPRKQGPSGDAPDRPHSPACSLDPRTAPGASGGWKRRTKHRPPHASA